MEPFRTDGLQKTLQTPQGNFFCLGSLCADFFREMKLVNVLLRDFIADVAPAPDQELSQGHAPMRMRFLLLYLFGFMLGASSHDNRSSCGSWSVTCGTCVRI